MKHTLLITALIALSCSTSAQQTVQEKLGYPKNTKLLIIHADDLGVSHSENTASVTALEKGSVSSASIMVPCPWMPEIGLYAKAHPNTCLGLHLTLTAEWKHYKWGPVLPRTEVPSLVESTGFLPDNSEAVAKNAKLDEIEKELRAQVERSKQFGIDPSHFDTHMGSAFGSKDIAKIYVKLGHEYKVPVLFPRGIENLLGTTLKDLGAENDVITDNVYIASPADYAAGMMNYYTKILNSIGAGLNVLLLHAALDNDEMKAVTIDHPDYGAAWRQADLDFFTSDECRKLLKDNNIKVVSWKDIRDKIVRK